MHARRLALLALVAACGGHAPPTPSGSGATTTTTTAAPSSPELAAKLAAATTAWLAGDLPTATAQLTAAGAEPRALALLARLHETAGRPDDARRVLAQLPPARPGVVADTTRVQRAVLSPDGRFAATYAIAPDYSVTTTTIWDVLAGRDVFAVRGDRAAFGIDPASHETLVVIDDPHDAGALHAFVAATGAPAWSTVERSARIYDVEIDARGVVTALTDHHALVQYDLATGTRRRELATKINAAVLQVAADSATLVAAETAIAIDPAGTIATLTELPSLASNGNVADEALAPDGKTFAVSSKSGELFLDERDGSLRVRVARAGSWLRWLGDGTLLALDRGDPKVPAPAHVRRFDAAGALLGDVALDADLVPIALGAGGHVLARRGAELVVVAVARATAVAIATFGGASRATALAWSPDGARLAIASALGPTTVWTVATGEAIHVDVEAAPPITTLAFAPTGGLTPEPPAIHPLEVVEQRVFVNDAAGAALRFVEAPAKVELAHVGGDRLLATDERGAVRAWNAATAEGLGVLDDGAAANHDRVVALAVRPDGKVAAIARDRGGVELWDLAARVRVVDVVAWGGFAAVAPDGRVDGTPSALAWRAGDVVLHAATLAPARTPDLAGTLLAAARPPATVTPTPPPSLPPRGCLPADATDYAPSALVVDGLRASFCLTPFGGDPYCFAVDLATRTALPTPAPIAALAPMRDGPGRPLPTIEATATHGLRVCAVDKTTCHELALAVDPKERPIAASDDGALLAVAPRGASLAHGARAQVETYDLATGKRLARFTAHFGGAHSEGEGGTELAFFGHAVVAIGIPCAGPCGEGTLYDVRGKRLGELAVEASSFTAEHFHDDLYVVQSIDDRFVVQDAATGKVVAADPAGGHFVVRVAPDRIVRAVGIDGAGAGGAIVVHDAAARPILTLAMPRCKP